MLHPESYEKYFKPDPKTGKILGTRIADLMGAIMVTEEKEISHQHLPFPAHVTAKSRRKIAEPLWLVGDGYYTDTDCFVTKKDDVPCSLELGELKLEAPIEQGLFFAPKFYMIRIRGKWKVKSKGFSNMSESAFRFLVEHGPDDLDAPLEIPKKGVAPCTVFADTSGGRWRRLDKPHHAVAIERMARPKEMLSRSGGDSDRVQPETLTIIKSLRFGKEKRRFSADGMTSQPYSVREIHAEFPDKTDPWVEL